MSPVNERELPEVVVFDHMPQSVRLLIAQSTIAGAVQLNDRGSMIGAGGIVTEVQPIIPPEAWSTSEQILWQYIASLAGQGHVNLQELVGYFRGSGQMVLIIDALESVVERVSQ